MQAHDKMHLKFPVFEEDKIMMRVPSNKARIATLRSYNRHVKAVDMDWIRIS